MSLSTEEMNSYFEELKADAMMEQGTYSSAHLAFESVVLKQISDLIDIEEPVIADCVLTSKDNRILGQIHGYALSANKEVLHLFYALYDSTTEIQTKNNSDCQTAISRVQGFCQKAMQNVHGDFDPESNEYAALKHIYDNRSNFKTVNIVLLTNSLTKDISVKKYRISEKVVLLDVWDLKRIYDNTHSLGDHMVIDVDFESEAFNNYRIPFIQMESTQYGYKCIQALLPARLLYQLYEHYNTNLLYSNVRFFLGLKKKGPNQNMLNTLRKKNEMFLAYNNGITALAKGVETVCIGDKKNITETDNNSSSQYITMGFLKKILDFRIVNGGQTTATIFTAKKIRKTEDKVNLMGVFIQAKIIICDNIDDLAADITKSTNFQNQVKAGEFTVSNKFNMEMENLSRRMFIPTKPTEHSFWYYERLKGQYDEERKKCKTKLEITIFEKSKPKKCKFSKEEIAKIWLSWEQRPYEAVKGATTAYTTYMNENSNRIPDEKYYRETIALLIIYRYLLNREGAREYRNGKATVVAYTIAMLKRQSFSNFNLDKMWKDQDLSSELKSKLNELSDQIFNILNNGASALDTTVLSYGKTKAAFENVERQINFTVNELPGEYMIKSI